MRNSKSVSILGCGWLGFPLGIELVRQNFQVRGSTTDSSKKSKLESAGIAHYALDLNIDTDQLDLENFFLSSYLIIAVPPRIRQGNDYYAQVKKIIPLVEKSPIESVIFISSTSVYPNTNTEVDEEFQGQPDTKSGQVLLEVEKMLSKGFGFKTVILRMAGLIGPERHPGRFLAGKKQLANPDGTVNLIHLNDCINIILRIIEKDIPSGIYNCCSDVHRTRREYYTYAAQALGLEPPGFIDSEDSKLKIISNKKLKSHLDYSFEFPDPSDCI